MKKTSLPFTKKISITTDTFWIEHLDDTMHDARAQTLIVAHNTSASLAMIIHNPSRVRRDITVQVADNGRFDFYGIVYGSKPADFTLNLRVIQHGAQSKSDIIFRGTLHAKSSVHMNGAIVIGKNASHSEGALDGKMLLFHKKARVNITPELEIHNDSARAHHGVSIGQVPYEHLYYLESRGIPNKDAEKMIEQGFLDDVLQKIPDAKARRKSKQTLAAIYGY